MAIRLDTVPPALVAPARPGKKRWFGLLVLLVLIGPALAFWLSGDAGNEPSGRLWLIALGGPVALWGVLAFVRGLLMFGEWVAVDGWNDEREKELSKRMRVGRRSQQVLAVSARTALHEIGAGSGQALQHFMQNNRQALKVQSEWEAGNERICHSRLYWEADDSPALLLQRMLCQVLDDIAKVLATVPEDQPLALLLDFDSRIAQEQLSELWRTCWSASGIRQPLVPVEGCGLQAVDEWLDRRIRDPAMLWVVSSQVAPTDVEGSAEAVVSLLFGNRLTQSHLQPLAYLHRPEQQREASKKGLRCAIEQVLDWVPVQAHAIQHVWSVGADLHCAAGIDAVLDDMSLLQEHPQNLHHLNTTLGNPGCAGSWLAIATAVDSIQEQGAPHLIFNAESTADMWCAVVMPPSAR
jgi:hypothetical protein